MTRFFNISTDTTLGGNSPSDDTVSSQKAIKNYVDSAVPTVNNSLITVTQGGVTKGSFNLNQASPSTIALDAGGGGSGDYYPDLFDFKWKDYLMNNQRWKRADDFQWQTGTDSPAYTHLVSDLPARVPAIGFGIYDKIYYVRYPDGDSLGDAYPYCWHAQNSTSTRYTSTETPVGGTAHSLSTGGVSIEITDVSTALPIPESETVAGVTIQFYQATDGHKICLPDQETALTNLYNTAGVAWYYIVDTANTRFKLPRSKHEHYGDRPVVGTGKGLGLTGNSSDTSDASLWRVATSNVSWGLTAYNQSPETLPNTSITHTSFGGGSFEVGVQTDPTKSGMVSTSVQDTDQYKYLYFYVGEFTQNL